MNQDPGAESWQPVASMRMMRQRAEILRRIRIFFDDAGVLEVDTPGLSACANTDPHIDSFAAIWRAAGSGKAMRRWLHSSPEFAMKRLLAAGSGPIYQICKVFRNGESGRLHNPEFTLVEWYRPDFDHSQLMDEVADLVNCLLPQPREVEKIPYDSLFEWQLGVDPFFSTIEELRQAAIRFGIQGAKELELADADGWLDLLFSHLIQPSLGNRTLCFVHGYPASQASLASLDPRNPAAAERFELFFNGIELANGFHELRDSQEQRQRFRRDLRLRKERGLTRPPMDTRLLAALEQGLPDCSGVALGLDRLLMVITGESHIDQVLAFPFARA